MSEKKEIKSSKETFKKDSKAIFLNQTDKKIIAISSVVLLISWIPYVGALFAFVGAFFILGRLYYSRNISSDMTVAISIVILALVVSILSTTNYSPKIDSNDNSSTQQTKNDESTGEKGSSQINETPKQVLLKSISGLAASKRAFDAGSYVAGDIPEGEYVFISMDSGGSYYSEEDGSGNIIDNENFDSFGYVYVHGLGNITTRGIMVSVGALSELDVSGAREMYEKLNEVSGYNQAAWYKIGTDLPAGSYVFESYGSGYGAVMTGPVGNSDIVDNENFNGKWSANVTDGQYLKLSRARLLE